MKNIYIISPDYGYEGLGNPIGAFDTRDAAEDFINRYLVQRPWHDSEYIITCSLYNPINIDHIKNYRF